MSSSKSSKLVAAACGAQPGASGWALSVCADAVVGNELSVVRWHFVSFLGRRTPVSPLPVLRDPRGRVPPWVTLS